MIWWAWIILAVVCMAIEVHFTHDFSLFCAGAAAFIVAIVTILTGAPPHWSQWLLFAALTVAILLALRKPLLGRFRLNRGTADDMDYLVGEVATPDADMAAEGVGRAELRGALWTARNAGLVTLRKGQRCRVQRLEGLTLWLRPE